MTALPQPTPAEYRASYHSVARLVPDDDGTMADRLADLIVAARSMGGVYSVHDLHADLLRLVVVPRPDEGRPADLLDGIRQVKARYHRGEFNSPYTFAGRADYCAALAALLPDRFDPSLPF